MTSNSRVALLAVAVLTGAVLSSCNKAEKETRTETAAPARYHLKGKVVSIDRQAGEASIDGEEIPGFMSAMIMPYKVKDRAALARLSPGDSITADVVVQASDSWLENVKVTQPSGKTAPKPAAALHIPAPRDPVPDFELINQNGKHIRLKQYRGKTVLLTFIYTRCPFPDYCPRVSHEFAEIESKLRADPALYRGTHLLSISFDPAHDTPKILRAYGFSCFGSADPARFTHWVFANSPSTQLPALANFFGFTYQDEGGILTHSLSTALIGPDGRIFKWYHGSDWQADELLKATADSIRQAGASDQDQRVADNEGSNNPRQAY